MADRGLVWNGIQFFTCSEDVTLRYISSNCISSTLNVLMSYMSAEMQNLGWSSFGRNNIYAYSPNNIISVGGVSWTSGASIALSAGQYLEVVLEENTGYKLSGKWKVDEEYGWMVDDVINYGVSFNSGGVDYNYMRSYHWNDDAYLYYGTSPNSSDLTEVAHYDYDVGNNSWADFDKNSIVDFGSTEQEVGDIFYQWFTSTFSQYQEPAAPIQAPDWANCFVKTSAGNKAVEKVWIKQGSSLNVVWEKPVVTYTVTNNLTNCTSNNSATTVTQGTSYTATITASDGYTLDGATVSVTMGGTDITATAYSNGVITIASVTGDIVVTVAAEIVASIIGFTGLTNSSGALTWTDDIASLQSSSPYTTTTSGNYVSVTGALDSYFPYNQITEVEDGNGNTFIRFPKCYIKWTNNSSGNIDGFQVSNTQVDSDYFIPDCFLNPNSVDGTDSYLDYVDIGKYEGSGSSSMVYSKSGAFPLRNVRRANYRTGCRAYGTSSNYYNGYQQLDIQTFTFYNFLCMLYYRTSNIQSVYAGRTDSNNTSAYSTGSTDGVTGLNGWNTSTTCVKMLGVENPYGNVFKWCDGIYFSSTTMYIHRYPTQYADSTANGTTMGYSRPSTSNYVQYLRQGTANNTKSVVYCSSVGTTTSTGDYYYYGPASTYVLTVGGSWRLGDKPGLWCMYAYAVTFRNDSVGGRLCRRPM